MNNFEKANSSIQETIHKLDEKSSFLFTATGIIFGLSALLVSPLISKTNSSQLIAIYLFTALYLATFVILVFLFSFTIFPRTKNVKEHPFPYNLYFEDIYSKSNDLDFNLFLSTDASIETLIDQIKVNSSIAHKKRILLITSVVFTIIFSFEFVALIILALI